MIDDTSRIIDGATAQKIFIDAIPKQELALTASKLLTEDRRMLNEEARHLAEEAITACGSISKQMATIQSDCVALLKMHGVLSEPLGDIQKHKNLQFHRADIRISRDDLGPALSTLSDIGFTLPIGRTPGRIKSLARSVETIQLIRFDEVTTRLILHFTSPPTSWIPKRLRPGMVDIAGIDLPASISPLYDMMKPIRIVTEKITSKRSPFHEIDFLGTPNGLIEPILDCFNLTPEDVFLDLGCGDGRIVTVAAEKFGCRAIGLEHNVDLADRARKSVANSPAHECIEIRNGDAKTADLSEATVIFMFLPLAVLSALLPSVKHRMKDTARLVVHEQSRPKNIFNDPVSIPVFGPDGITIVHIQTGATKKST